MSLTFLFVAHLAVWAGIFAYLYLLMRRTAELRREIAALRHHGDGKGRN